MSNTKLYICVARKIKSLHIDDYVTDSSKESNTSYCDSNLAYNIPKRILVECPSESFNKRKYNRPDKGISDSEEKLYTVVETSFPMNINIKL